MAPHLGPCFALFAARRPLGAKAGLSGAPQRLSLYLRRPAYRLALRTLLAPDLAPCARLFAAQRPLGRAAGLSRAPEAPSLYLRRPARGIGVRRSSNGEPLAACRPRLDLGAHVRFWHPIWFPVRGSARHKGRLAARRAYLGHHSASRSIFGDLARHRGAPFFERRTPRRLSFALGTLRPADLLPVAGSRSPRCRFGDLRQQLLLYPSLSLRRPGAAVGSAVLRTAHPSPLVVRAWTWALRSLLAPDLAPFFDLCAAQRPLGSKAGRNVLAVVSATCIVFVQPANACL